MKLVSVCITILCLSILIFGQSPSPSPTPDMLGADKVGLNTPTPVVPLHFSVHYPVNTTASEELIRFSVPNGHDAYGFYQRTTVFGDDQTNSVGRGFFPAGDVQAAPSFVWIDEDTFDHGNNAQFEWHLQTNTIDGGSQRPITGRVIRKTGETFITTSATSSFYAGGNLLQVSPGEVFVEGLFRGRSNSIKFETLDNGGVPTKQIHVIPHPLDSQLSVLEFGAGANGVKQFYGMGEMRFEKNGAGANVDAGAYKVEGVKVVGAQCAPIPTVTDDKLSVTTINKILECMRAHGLIGTSLEVTP